METEPREAGLARRARDGDREALTELVERSRERLFALALAETRHYEDAQDAVAAALLRVCLHVKTLRDPRRVREWMHTVVRNEARQIARRRGGARLQTVDCDELPAAMPEEATILRLDIARALRALPAEQARAVALFYMVGLPVAAIARRLARPEGTIKRWLHGGRQRLAREMEGYMPATETWSAAIVATDLSPDTLQSLTQAMRAAGWDEVKIVRDYGTAAELEEAGEGEACEFHLPRALQDCRLIVLDEWIDGRSAFELYTLLKITVERPAVAACLLLANPVSRATLLAAWAAGFLLCLSKPVDPVEFEEYTRRIRREMEEEAAGGAISRG